MPGLAGTIYACQICSESVVRKKGNSHFAVLLPVRRPHSINIIVWA